jgi:hypothetical protein
VRCLPKASPLQLLNQDFGTSHSQVDRKATHFRKHTEGATAGFGTSRTSGDVRLESAKWATADETHGARRRARGSSAPRWKCVASAVWPRKSSTQGTSRHPLPLFIVAVKYTYLSAHYVLDGEAPMTRLLCTTLLCALGTAQASAQTLVSQQLLELEDDERNAAFTLMLQDGHQKCDQVVRTLFRGTVLGMDEWEAMCRDRHSYSFTILVEPNETMITFVSCRELLATSKMLLHRAGSKSKASGCRIK